MSERHAQGYLPIRQSPSMFLCSSFSIAAGGSLGPEAPLLALCAATTSWLGRKVQPAQSPLRVAAGLAAHCCAADLHADSWSGQKDLALLLHPDLIQ